MLYRSVRSALAQTVRDIEVFILGDGVPDSTREIAADLMREDSRVRFFDHPKSPRTGEPYRHLALDQAKGRIVCYLSDDDLYFPEHVATMEELLTAVDFAHAPPVYIRPDQSPGIHVVDVELSSYRTDYRAAIPLTCAAHTLDFYRRLPHGWRTTPVGLYTDRYMWQQILDTGCRAASGRRMTTLCFPSPQRPDWTIEERCEELDQWSERIATEPSLRGDLASTLLGAVIAQQATAVDRHYASRSMRAIRVAQTLRRRVAQVPGVRPLARRARRIAAVLRGR